MANVIINQWIKLLENTPIKAEDDEDDASANVSGSSEDSIHNSMTHSAVKDQEEAMVVTEVKAQSPEEQEKQPDTQSKQTEEQEAAMEVDKENIMGEEQKKAKVKPPEIRKIYPIRRKPVVQQTFDELANANSETNVIKYESCMLVTTPVPRALVQQLAVNAAGGRGRKKKVPDQPTPEPEQVPAEQKPIKITIKSGAQVLAEVSSHKTSVTPSVPKASVVGGKDLSKNKKNFISPEFIPSEDDEEDDEDSDDKDFVEEWKKSKRKKPVNKVRKVVDSDEDFVVEEWDDKPSKQSKPVKSVPKKGKIPIKKGIRVLISDSDSDDSLPNIDLNEKKPKKEIEESTTKMEVDEPKKSKSLSSAVVKKDSDSISVKTSSKKVKSESEEKIKEEKIKKEVSVKNESKDNDKCKVKSENEKSRKYSESRSDSVGSDSSVEKTKDRSRHSSSDDKKKERSKSSSSSSDKKRDHDHHHERKSSSDKEKSSSSSSSSKERDRERDRERERRKEKERRERKEREQYEKEKTKSTLEKAGIKSLSTDGLAKIPKKPASFLDALGSADTSGESQIKKPPVKVKSHGFRSTGLMDTTAPKAPGIAGKRTISTSLSSGDGALKLNDKYGITSSGKHGGSDALKALNKRPLEDAATAVGGDKRFKSTISSQPLSSDRPGGVKLISPKRRKWPTLPVCTSVAFIGTWFLIVCVCACLCNVSCKDDKYEQERHLRLI